MEKEKRKQRRDAGIRKLTERDITALRWIGEMYAIRMDHLDFLVRNNQVEVISPKELVHPAQQSISFATRSLVSRWIEAGWVECQKILANSPRWIWLTRQGINELDLPHGYFFPKAGILNHVSHVNTARMWIHCQQPEYHWVNERELRQQQKSGHIADGEVITPQTTVAIEVELTAKKAERVTQIIHGLISQYSTVWYFVNATTKGVVEKALEIADENTQKRVKVYPWF
jgi:hypothetical protein